eukprot:4321833-Pleurochrysis_carterae.AAC.1
MFLTMPLSTKGVLRQWGKIAQTVRTCYCGLLSGQASSAHAANRCLGDFCSGEKGVGSLTRASQPQ